MSFRDYNSVESFLDERTIRQSNECVGKGALYAVYKDYCETEMLEVLNMRDFGTVLKKLGFEDTRVGSERRWKGLLLAPDGHDPYQAKTDAWRADTANIFKFGKEGTH